MDDMPIYGHADGHADDVRVLDMLMMCDGRYAHIWTC